MVRTEQGRTLKTARAVLQVMRFMAEWPGGVEAEDVAHHLAKSEATAGYLLNSLCREGYVVRGDDDGLYHLRTATHDLVLTPEDSAGRAIPEAPYVDALEELYRMTGQRAYLVSIEDRSLVVQEARGRQGLPTMPGLGKIIQKEAHAVAVGKVILASSPNACTAAYIGAFGLPAYTQHTVTSPRQLDAQARSIQRLGYGVDREEFAAGFSCIAAPLFDSTGAVRGALGLSTTAGRFVEHRGHFTRTVRDIAKTASALVHDHDLTAEAV